MNDIEIKAMKKELASEITQITNSDNFDIEEIYINPSSYKILHINLYIKYGTKFTELEDIVNAVKTIIGEAVEVELSDDTVIDFHYK